MRRITPIVALLLAVLCGAASADSSADASSLESGIKQAFLTGEAVPEAGTGPGRDRALALRQLVLAVQAGTDGSDDQKKKLRQDIDSLSARIGAPPQTVIDAYLSRIKGAPRPMSGTSNAPERNGRFAPSRSGEEHDRVAGVLARADAAVGDAWRSPASAGLPPASSNENTGRSCPAGPEPDPEARRTSGAEFGYNSNLESFGQRESS